MFSPKFCPRLIATPVSDHVILLVSQGQSLGSFFTALFSHVSISEPSLKLVSVAFRGTTSHHLVQALSLLSGLPPTSASWVGCTDRSQSDSCNQMTIRSNVSLLKLQSCSSSLEGTWSSMTCPPLFSDFSLSPAVTVTFNAGPVQNWKWIGADPNDDRGGEEILPLLR